MEFSIVIIQITVTEGPILLSADDDYV